MKLEDSDMAGIKLGRATIASYWVGLIGTVVGLFGFGFSIYLAYRDRPDFSLMLLSGWAAALILGVIAVRVGSNLIGAILTLQRNYQNHFTRATSELQATIKAGTEEIASLRIALSQQEERAAQAIAISQFIADRAVMPQPTPRQKKSDHSDEGAQ